MNVRVLNGFIEVERERVAQILPGKDDRDIGEALGEFCEAQESDAYNEGLEDGKAEAENKAEEAVHEFNDKIDQTLERLLKDGLISEEIHELLCERLPAP